MAYNKITYIKNLHSLCHFLSNILQNKLKFVQRAFKQHVMPPPNICPKFLVGCPRPHEKPHDFFMHGNAMRGNAFQAFWATPSNPRMHSP